MRVTTILMSAALVSACAPAAMQTRPLTLSPEQAVFSAAGSPAGVSGVFAMVVRASGRQDGLLFLNSELDYRDPRNLTIVVAPAFERALAERLGGPVETVLAKQPITVRGTARKVRIDFLDDGRVTGKYYFQTHLMLQSAVDLAVDGARPAA